MIQPVDIPIVGPTGRMNDHYVDELREDLDLTIDAVDKAGYLDRDRLGIGGHSYGAFSTMNAMTHTPFFKAGIAGDGMYNRTLTPYDFQNERRTFWEAQETYVEMSPFFYADRFSGALLMYHSLEDQNVGTDPDQLDPHDAGAAGAGETGRAVHVSVRGSRSGDARVGSRSVGAMDRVVRHVREEPAEEDGQARGRRSLTRR